MTHLIFLQIIQRLKNIYLRLRLRFLIFFFEAIVYFTIDFGENIRCGIPKTQRVGFENLSKSSPIFVKCGFSI